MREKMEGLNLGSTPTTEWSCVSEVGIERTDQGYHLRWNREWDFAETSSRGVVGSDIRDFSMARRQNLQSRANGDTGSVPPMPTRKYVMERGAHLSRVKPFGFGWRHVRQLTEFLDARVGRPLNQGMPSRALLSASRANLSLWHVLSSSGRFARPLVYCRSMK